MASRASTGWIATFVVLIPLFIVAWFMLPLFLPMWRWQNVDWPALAAELKQPEERLTQRFTVVLRYGPRGADDPIPWQIASMKPSWQSIDPENRIDETNLMVRASVLSDRTGEPPSGLLATVGSTSRDRWFKADGWRLPPGALGQNGKRPVFIVDMATWEKLGITLSMVNEGQITDRKVETDDAWEDRDDGWKPGPRNEISD